MRCLERLLILSLSVFSLFFNAYGAEIILKNSIVVNTDDVYLGSVAEIKGSKLEKEILKDIKIASSPYLCKSKILNEGEIERRVKEFLKFNGVDLTVNFKGSPVVQVKRACGLLPQEKVIERIKLLIDKLYPDYVFISASVPKIVLPYSSFDLSVSISSLSSYYGRAVCKVLKKGKVVKTVWIPFRVEKKVYVVVAKRNIPAGEILTYRDVEIRPVPESRGRNGLISLKEVVGKVVKRDIRAGEVIKRRDLKPNFIVLRGKPVKVIYDLGSIHIELLGLPMENGALGDIIKVKNISTGKKLLCKVVGQNTVVFLSR